MKARVEIEVKDRKEARAIRLAVEDPEIKAFLIVSGILKQLSTDGARARVLAFVRDFLDEQVKRKERNAL